MTDHTSNKTLPFVGPSTVPAPQIKIYRGFEFDDEFRHSGRLHAFGIGERCKALRPAEHQHGQRRQARRADARFLVGDLDAAQQADGAAMEHVRQRMADGLLPHLRLQVRESA